VEAAQQVAHGAGGQPQGAGDGGGGLAPLGAAEHGTADGQRRRSRHGAPPQERGRKKGRRGAPAVVRAGQTCCRDWGRNPAGGGGGRAARGGGRGGGGVGPAGGGGAGQGGWAGAWEQAWSPSTGEGTEEGPKRDSCCCTSRPNLLSGFAAEPAGRRGGTTYWQGAIISAFSWGQNGEEMPPSQNASPPPGAPPERRARGAPGPVPFPIALLGWMGAARTAGLG